MVDLNRIDRITRFSINGAITPTFDDHKSSRKKTHCPFGQIAQCGSMLKYPSNSMCFTCRINFLVLAFRSATGHTSTIAIVPNTSISGSFEWSKRKNMVETRMNCSHLRQRHRHWWIAGQLKWANSILVVLQLKSSGDDIIGNAHINADAPYSAPHSIQWAAFRHIFFPSFFLLLFVNNAPLKQMNCHSIMIKQNTLPLSPNNALASAPASMIDNRRISSMKFKPFDIFLKYKQNDDNSMVLSSVCCNPLPIVSSPRLSVALPHLMNSINYFISSCVAAGCIMRVAINAYRSVKSYVFGLWQNSDSATKARQRKHTTK